ncbi:uncharacterized protein EAF02_001689 [Botrytis sinoallii]|uniref:uncharacterized protein n=1 Tax=Botrytis sinoallii TaxID=1463999 RepID=UPI0018FF954C|nr:uncharacterized protein EAF02_001689 [Botrytis sinoallii]KAF7891364.1 hypothetical protein EAF02_001689 [Botrytis sinoallii]
MSYQYTLHGTQGPGRHHFKCWENQVFVQMRRNTKIPYLHLYALPLPRDHQKRKSVGELDGLDLEDAKKLQQAADEIIAQTRDDFVQKLSDKERANGRLMFEGIKELSEDANYADAFAGSKMNHKMRRLWVVLRDEFVFLSYGDDGKSSWGCLTRSIVFRCFLLLATFFEQVFSGLEGLRLKFQGDGVHAEPVGEV